MAVSTTEANAGVPKRDPRDACNKDGVGHAVETLAVIVRSLAGSVIAHVDPAPENVELLRKEIEARCGIPAAVQKLMRGTQVLSGGQLLTEYQGPARDLTLVVDECPLFSWDFEGNPNSALLGGSRHEVYVRGMRLRDQVNVVTQAPITCGAHFFEFIMHTIGDEQWCGITPQCAHASCGERDEGCFYYSGRRSGCRGALHAPKEGYCQLDSVERPQYARVDSGDSIGMLLDVDTGAVVFLLNGKVQGACRVPRQPWLLTTSLEADRDHLELRKSPVPEAPDEALTLLRQSNLPRVLFRQFTTQVEVDGLLFY